MPISVEFLPVGDSDGDAILVKYGDGNGFWLTLVDGGYSQVGEKVVEHIHSHYGRDIIIHNMVVSHADNDHASGLIPIFKQFRVGALWMNRPWLYANEVIHQFHGNWTLQGWIDHVRGTHEYLVELETMARARGMEPNEIFQGALIGCSLVLAPSRQRYISLIPDLDKTPPPYKSDAAPRSLAVMALGLLDHLKETFQVETLDPNPPATSASNETSVVQLCSHEGRKILLTADVGPDGLLEAAQYAYGRGLLSLPDLVQIPHQGSRRNVTPAVLNAWLGQPNGGSPTRGEAYVMVGAKKPDHPRKKVKNAFIRRGHPVTRDPPGLLSEQQIENVRSRLKTRLNIDIPKIAGSDRKTWWPIARQIYADVAKSGKPDRIDTFNGNYGLNRGLASSCLVLVVVALAHADWLIAAGLLGGAVVYIYRAYRFGVHYARELYLQFLFL